MIVINNREAIPCDVLIVGVDEPSPETPAGIAYVETKSLDGETNLKIRQVGAFASQSAVHVFLLTKATLIPYTCARSAKFNARACLALCQNR